MIPTILPPDTPESSARRLELSRTWETQTTVYRRLPDAAGLLRAGRLLRVWVPELNAYRFPDFQFDGDGRPLHQLGGVLAVLRTVVRAETGWEEIEWLVAPNVLLGGCTPASVLQNRPQEVLDIATRQIAAHPDAGW